MAKDVKFPNTLVSNSADNPAIANTNNIYDKTQKLMQDVLNEVLSRYFNFGAGSAKDKVLDGGAISDGSIVVGKLSASLQALVEKISTIDTLAGKIESLQGVYNGLVDRVRELEMSPVLIDIERTPYDGFFLVDSQDYVGSCVIPEVENGGSISWGWTGDHTNAPTLTNRSGGLKILVRQADFSAYGLQLSDDSVDITRIVVGEKALTGTTLQLSAIAIPRTRELTANSFAWTVAKGQEYIGTGPASVVLDATGVDDDDNTIYAVYATFNILPAAASGGIVEVSCHLNGTYLTETYRKTVYYNDDVAVTSVAVDYSTSGISTSNMVATNPYKGYYFNLKAALTPANANIASYDWEVLGTGVTIQSESSRHSKTCSFVISQNAASSTPVTIRVSATDTKGNTVTSEDFNIYVQYGTDNSLQGLRLQYAPEVADAQAQLVPIAEPAAASLSAVSYDVLTGNATVDDEGLLTVADNAAVGDTIMVMAKTPNPNYDSSIADSDSNPEYFEAAAIMTNGYEAPLKSLEIKPGNIPFVGQTLRLEAVPTPNIDAYKAVTWRAAGSKYVSIDAFGNLTIAPEATGQQRVSVLAMSSVNKKIQAVADILMTYENPNTSGRTVRLIHPIVSVGGEYVDFYAYGYTGYTTDKTTVVDTGVTWEVMEVKNTSDSVAEINKGITDGTATAGASINAILPVNMGRVTSPDILNDSWYTSEDVAEVSGVTPSVGPLKALGSTNFTYTFVESSSGGLVNRLYLNPNIEGPQAVCVRCTYGTDISYTQWFEFTYQAGKLPVTDLTVTQHTLNGFAPRGTAYDWHYLAKDYIKPIVAAGKSVDDYVFDYNKIAVCHTDGEADSIYTHLSRSQNGIKLHITNDADHTSEHLRIVYALDGEEPYWLNDNWKQLAIENAGGRAEYYYPLMRNYNTSPVAFTFTGYANTITATSIKITGVADTYDGDAMGTAEGMIIDGVQFGVADASTNQSLDKTAALFTIIEGGEYCSIDAKGNRMRLYSTGGEFKKVTVKAALAGMEATASFYVKLS